MSNLNQVSIFTPLRMIVFPKAARSMVVLADLDIILDFHNSHLGIFTFFFPLSHIQIHRSPLPPAVKDDPFSNDGF